MVIARAGRPLVRLVPLREHRGERRLGRLKGQIRMAEDFDAADAHLAALFEGHREGDGSDPSNAG